MTAVRALLAVVAAAGSLTGCTSRAKSVTTGPGAAVAVTGSTGVARAVPYPVPPTFTFGTAAGPRGATTSTTATSPTTSRRPVDPTPVISVTAADSGRTLMVRVGYSIRLLLDDPAIQWSSPTVGPDGLLISVPAPAPPPHGRLAIWTAAQTGTAKVTAVGTAWCAAGVACPMYARLFDLTLLIS